MCWLTSSSVNPEPLKPCDWLDEIRVYIIKLVCIISPWSQETQPWHQPDGPKLGRKPELE